MEHRHPVNIRFYEHRSSVDAKVDTFVGFFGSLKFISYMTLFIIAWITLNSLALTNTIHFDKYPYILLNLLFSTQASYAAPLILLSQNRQAEIDRQKAEHDFAVNQKALDGITDIQKLLVQHESGSPSV